MMHWEQLLTDKRLGREDRAEYAEKRTDFQRDYDRLIFSAAFRRLQNKTQIFPLPGKIFVHNRLTHSLEVSCVGRSLGDCVGRWLERKYPDSKAPFREIGTIVSAACLAHDMGNPPFGHSGERAITAYFAEGQGTQYKAEVEKEGGRWTDFLHFEGNANAFRLLTHSFKGRRAGGFALTYSTLASIIKYPYPSDHPKALQKKKFGFFQTEEAAYLQIARKLGIPERENKNSKRSFARYPLVYLVEAADDICYQLMDIEDAYKLKILDLREAIDILWAFVPEEQQLYCRKELEQISDKNEKVAYLRSEGIGFLVDACSGVFMEHEEEILRGEFQGGLCSHLPQAIQEAYRQCAQIAMERIYPSKEVVDIELAGFTIFSDLLDRLILAQREPEKAYSKLWIGRVPEQYDLHRPSLYGKIQTALDYISGMTDIYALDLYRILTGMALPAI